MITLNRSLPPGRSKADIPFTLVRLAQRGFTLIELMIAMVIGLLVVLALTTLFVNISRTNNEMAKTNAQIESGRFAIQLLESDIVHGGYWGSYLPPFDDLTMPASIYDPLTMAPSAVPDPCLAYNVANWTTAYKDNLIAIPVQSYESTPASCVASTAVANQKANTDMLVVRHAETCLPGVGNCEADTAGKLYFQPSFCELEIAGGLRHRLDTAGFSTLGTGLHQRDCVGTGIPQTLPIISGLFADKRKFVSNIYFISDVNGIPTLMRSPFDGTAHQAAVPLIEGIEGFRVEFGVDSIGDMGTVVDYNEPLKWDVPENRVTPLNRGDGAPDGAFVRCTTAVPCTATQFANVVAVKLYVLARNKDITPGYTDTKTYTLGATTLGPFNDNYKRHVYSTTVRLTNISGRRETP